MQPAHAGVGGWHQDGSSAYDFKQLGYPVPLVQLRASFLLTDQTEPGMGNMELIPGSHRSQVRLPADVVASQGRRAYRARDLRSAGSVLVFHNAVWHRTYSHNGDRDRYTAHYIYSPPWVPAPTGSKTRRSSSSALPRYGGLLWASSLGPTLRTGPTTKRRRSPPDPRRRSKTSVLSRPAGREARGPSARSRRGGCRPGRTDGSPPGRSNSRWTSPPLGRPFCPSPKGPVRGCRLSPGGSGTRAMLRPGSWLSLTAGEPTISATVICAGADQGLVVCPYPVPAQ